jgi:hypothetical protein
MGEANFASKDCGGACTFSAGCQWRYVPKDLPPKSTLYDYFDLWTYDGIEKTFGTAAAIFARCDGSGCQGKIAGPSRGHCLQSQTPLAAAKRLSGFEQAPSKPSPSTKPKTSSPSRRSTGDFPTITPGQLNPAHRSRCT